MSHVTDLAAVGAAGHADGLVAAVEPLAVHDERRLLRGRGPARRRLHRPQVHHGDVARQVLLHRLVRPAQGVEF